MVPENGSGALRRIHSCFVLLTLIGCTTVTSPTPVGAKATYLDPREWNGAWHCSEPLGAPILLAVTHPESGTMSIAGVWRNPQPWPGQWELEESSGVMRDGPRGLHILNVSRAGSESYTWMVAKWDPLRPGAGLFLWFPNGQVLRQMMEKGDIAGEYHSHVLAPDELVVQVTDEQLEFFIPRGVEVAERPAPERYVPDALYWTEPVFCNRMH
jgi:hypothetical protein